MKKCTRYLVSALLMFSTLSVLVSQSPLSENTLQLEENEKSPAASIEDMAWLAGTWRGEGLGATVEEVWSEPAAGGMMGMFRMSNDTGILFYELCQIVEYEGSLILRLKHFDKSLKGWEEKEEVVEFPLVKIEGEKAWFDGLTFELEGDRLRAYVVVEEGTSEETSEASFTFSRFLKSE